MRNHGIDVVRGHRPGAVDLRCARCVVSACDPDRPTEDKALQALEDYLTKKDIPHVVVRAAAGLEIWRELEA